MEYKCEKVEKRVFERNVPSASTIAANIKPTSTKSNAKLEASSTSVKLLIHKGVATDPKSFNAQEKHVYRDSSGNVYSASLTLTDLQAGKNSYCTIQVLESNELRRRYTFISTRKEILLTRKIDLFPANKKVCTWKLSFNATLKSIYIDGQKIVQAVKA